MSAEAALKHDIQTHLAQTRTPFDLAPIGGILVIHLTSRVRRFYQRLDTHVNAWSFDDAQADDRDAITDERTYACVVSDWRAFLDRLDD